MNKKPRKRATIQIPAQLHADFKYAAQLEGYSIGSLVQVLIKRWMAKWGPK